MPVPRSKLSVENAVAARGHAETCRDASPKRPFVGTWGSRRKSNAGGQLKCEVGEESPRGSGPWRAARSSGSSSTAAISRLRQPAPTAPGAWRQHSPLRSRGHSPGSFRRSALPQTRPRQAYADRCTTAPVDRPCVPKAKAPAPTSLKQPGCRSSASDEKRRSSRATTPFPRPRQPHRARADRPPPDDRRQAPRPLLRPDRLVHLRRRGHQAPSSPSATPNRPACSIGARRCSQTRG